jgi:glycosyltransferase involved in cell wall biosynthesis
MRILHVIHGYPMRYNAGAEIYTQTLCGAQSARHDVHVFTRYDDPFAEDYGMLREVDPNNSAVKLHIINVPTSSHRYRDLEVDAAFGRLLDEICPDVVHVGHLLNLSTSLVFEAKRRQIPVVCTLHDYWFVCPKGQFLQIYPKAPAPLWAACDGQDDRKCAVSCYAHHYSGSPEDSEESITAWTTWVSKRMSYFRSVAESIDLFIAPSHYLKGRFLTSSSVPAEKVAHLEYGFELGRLTGRQRRPGEPFTFGYIGTHIPAKGIHDLLHAFAAVEGDVRLRIWGRLRGGVSEALAAISDNLPRNAAERIEWRPEYSNADIVGEVFNWVDAIVVPSIWVENAPLVIQESLQARIPVITANVGGMAELIEHETNGLLFEFRNVSALSTEMQRLCDDPSRAIRLGERGYLGSISGDVLDIGSYAGKVEGLYRSVLA